MRDYKRYYFVYIITNKYKTVYYVGVTNSLSRRLDEHEKELVKGFSTRYRLKFLIHYEKFDDVNVAIRREKEIKKWSRTKKLNLIKRNNPNMTFLNQTVYQIAEKYL